MGPARLLALLMPALVAGGLASVAPAEGRDRHCRRCVFPLLTLPDVPEPEGPPVIIPYGEIPDPGVPYTDIPFGWDDRGAQPPSRGNTPYTQGFVLTYTVRHTDEAHRSGRLDRYADVGRALAACWSSSEVTRRDWREVTLRVSFKRDGSVNGVPRIQHLDAPGDAGEQTRLRTDLLATLGRCTPMPFTSALGSAVAGQIFAIRFIQAKDS